MVVENAGYRSLSQVIELVDHNVNFSIYNTTKGTAILVFGCNYDEVDLFRVKKDRIPWKIAEGKKITKAARKVYNSVENRKSDINLAGWNGKQIVTYKPAMVHYN